MTRPLVAYAGIAAIVLEWLTVLSFYILDFRYGAELRPLSYFATQPTTQAIFAAGFVISALLVWSFVIWAKKYIRISLTLFTISMICFAAVAVIPFRPENIQNMIQHENTAALFALTFVLGMFYVGLRNDDKDLRSISLASGIVGLMLGFVVWRVDGNNRLLVFLEIVCGLAAQYWTLWVSRYVLEKAKQST